MGVFKRKRTVSFKTIKSIKDSNQLVAYYNIDCCISENAQTLILGWIHCNEAEIHKLELGHTFDYESVWIERPELLKSNSYHVQEGSSPGFILKIDNTLMTASGLELMFHSDNHTWVLKINNNKLAGSTVDNNFKHFVKQFYKERFGQNKDCTSDKTPLISIVTPVYNTDQYVLEQTIKSVLNQSYDNWEWCIYDDGSSSVETKRILEELERRDSRINIERGSKLGMVHAYNKAISMTNGDWIALLDHDDTLSIDALCSIAKAIDENPGIKFLYTDEDLINTDGYFELPTMKGEFQMSKILSHNYINHLMVIKKDLGNSLNWFRTEYAGAQDYDLILRIIETIGINEIFYVDQVLYHWRQVESSINYDYSKKAYVLESGKKCLLDYYKRQGKKGRVIKGKKLGYYEFISE